MSTTSTSRIILRGIRHAEIWLTGAPETTRDVDGIQQISLRPKTITFVEEGNEHPFAVHVWNESVGGKIINGVFSFEAAEWLLGPTVTADSGTVTAKFRAGPANPYPTWGMSGFADYVVKDGIRSGDAVKFTIHHGVCESFDLALKDEEYFTIEADFLGVDDGTLGLFDIVST